MSGWPIDNAPYIDKGKCDVCGAQSERVWINSAAGLSSMMCWGCAQNGGHHKDCCGSCVDCFTACPQCQKETGIDGTT